jgi:hypothetical protein
MRAVSVLSYTVFLACYAAAQAPAPPAGVPESSANRVSEPLYRVTVVSRTTKAINYGHLTDPTKIGLKGTVLMTDAQGEARVESKRGAVEIEAKVNHLGSPTRFGPEYLTYVLWAITPEGRPVNLGELVADPSDKAKIKVSSDLQAFALIVTAEPYFSVTQPSDVVVMENVLQPDTIGRVQEVDAKYELLPRGHFTYDTGAPPTPPSGAKLSMGEYEAVVATYQAQNAIQIARAAGADKYAASTLQKAEQLYRQAVDLQAKKSSSRQIVTLAREAAQAAEDARVISAKHQQGEISAAPLPRS